MTGLATEWKDWLDAQDKADRDAAVQPEPIPGPAPVPGSPVIPPEGIISPTSADQP